MDSEKSSRLVWAAQNYSGVFLIQDFCSCFSDIQDINIHLGEIWTIMRRRIKAQKTKRQKSYDDNPGSTRVRYWIFLNTVSRDIYIYHLLFQIHEPYVPCRLSSSLLYVSLSGCRAQSSRKVRHEQWINQSQISKVVISSSNQLNNYSYNVAE